MTHSGHAAMWEISFVTEKNWQIRFLSGKSEKASLHFTCEGKSRCYLMWAKQIMSSKNKQIHTRQTCFLSKEVFTSPALPRPGANYNTNCRFSSRKDPDFLHNRRHKTFLFNDIMHLLATSSSLCGQTVHMSSKNMQKFLLMFRFQAKSIVVASVAMFVGRSLAWRRDKQLAKRYGRVLESV